jgi:hypothetical protein
LLKQLPIWATRAGYFGWPAATSFRLVSRAFTALVRAVTIHSIRKKVSPTRTKTGSKTI